MSSAIRLPSRRLLSLLVVLAGVGLLAIERPFLPRGAVDVVEPSAVNAAGAMPAGSNQLATLDVERLAQRSLPELSPSLFGNVVAVPPVSVVVVVPPPQPSKPSPPPLPYTYLGQFQDADGRLLFYLRRNNEVIVAKPGATLDESYRLESDLRNGLTFTYLPLKEAQVLPIGNLTQ